MPNPPAAARAGFPPPLGVCEPRVIRDRAQPAPDERPAQLVDLGAADAVDDAGLPAMAVDHREHLPGARGGRPGRGLVWGPPPAPPAGRGAPPWSFIGAIRGETTAGSRCRWTAGTW